MHAESDELLAVTCAAQRLVLLTTRRLIEFDGKHDYALHLTGELGSGLVSSTHATLEQFFAGLNAGEWGGGLRVIDAAQARSPSSNATQARRSAEGS